MVEVTRRITKVLDNHPLADKIRERIEARDISYLTGVLKAEQVYGKRKDAEYIASKIEEIKRADN